MIDISLINTLIEDLGFYTIMTPLLVITAIFTLPKFVDSTTYFKSRKIKYMNEALESNWVDSDSKRIFSESISRMYLYSSLGIKANKKEVEEILRIYDMLNKKFNAVEIYYALKIISENFFTLSLEKAKEEYENTVIQSITNKMLVFLTAFSIVLCYTYFIYHLIYAISNDIFFTKDYLLNDFSSIMGVVISTIGFFISYFSVKKLKNARKIMACHIGSLE
ncbi:hypothetical protein PSYCG_09955 [Psychrobacter sp. G]|uniref:hypothetical protein n=1 Tax=Psychrobacter sp. G TaxID=571800 RepID=UPI000354D256|nr:hypothetical protein [Psychrobacter sp. G]AGP49478.1 hypothetical protein PSYCG_09955 [Psychrobacter sp. G]